MSSLPSFFISHGSPDLPFQQGAAVDFLRQLGSAWERPQAILCISAHWGSVEPQITSSSQPPTIHDFRGFPDALYQISYAAPGDPALAERILSLLHVAGLPGSLDPERGLDHGVWSPLLLMAPKADIPVVQLSLQPRLDPQHHWRVGQALQSLRQAGVLIMGSGSVTHNLRAMGGYAINADPVEWASQFDDWLTQAITTGQTEAVLNYRQQAPFAVQSHPTDEHLLPLFVAMGAAGSEGRGRCLHTSFSYGALSMSAYAFGESPRLQSRTISTDKP